MMLHPRLVREQAISDQERERQIREALELCHAAKDKGDELEASRQWHRFVGLIRGRSKAQVTHMERARGLR